MYELATELMEEEAVALCNDILDGPHERDEMLAIRTFISKMRLVSNG